MEELILLCLEGIFLTLKDADILLSVSLSFCKTAVSKNISNKFLWNILPSSFRKHQEGHSLSVCLTVKIWSGGNTPRKRRVSEEGEPVFSFTWQKTTLKSENTMTFNILIAFYQAHMYHKIAEATSATMFLDSWGVSFWM
jgi:hypothetical protein